jgi:hypothetical protein
VLAEVLERYRRANRDVGRREALLALGQVRTGVANRWRPVGRGNPDSCAAELAPTAATTPTPPPDRVRELVFESERLTAAGHNGWRWFVEQMRAPESASGPAAEPENPYAAADAVWSIHQRARQRRDAGMAPVEVLRLGMQELSELSVELSEEGAKRARMAP